MLDETAIKGLVSAPSAAAELDANLKDPHTELLPLSKKVNRLEQAIMHIAQETGIKLTFDF